MKKSKYPPEFREEAVKAALSGERTLKEVAKSLGVSYWTLRDWKKEYLANQNGSENRNPGKLSAEAELEILRKENAELRMDNAILKKFAVRRPPGLLRYREIYDFRFHENSSWRVFNRSHGPRP